MLMFENDGGWQPPSELPRLPAGRVAIDTETKDEGLASNRGPGWAWGAGFIAGISLAWREEGAVRTVYLPVAHEGGGNLDRKLVLRWLLAQLRRTDIKWSFANALYDLGWLVHELELRLNQTVGVDLLEGRTEDVQIIAPLLNEYEQTYGLDHLGLRFLKEGKDERVLRRLGQQMGLKKESEIKGLLWRLPAGLVAGYAEQDAALTLRLAETMDPLWRAEELDEAVALEHDLLPALLAMRRNGVKLNVDRTTQLQRKYKLNEAAAVQEIKRITGTRCDPWNAVDISRALSSEGIKTPLTAQGGPSVTKELLAEWVEGGSKIAVLVQSARKWQKARGTFIEGHFLGHAVERGGEWRLFPEFNPLRAEREDGAVFGTVSYRFSSTGPNFQQLPGRDGELTADIRGCCEPEKGEQWIAADYSQQEPRLGIHFAAVSRVRGGEAAADRVRNDPKWDFHDFAAELTGVPRKKVKDISLGRMYGAGAGKIAQKLKLPFTVESGKRGTYLKAGPEAQAMVDEYDREMPWVLGMTEQAEKRARQRGYLRLLGGHKARFSDEGGIKGDYFRKAFNRLIQGSGAGQLKRSMIDAHKAQVRLIVTVHDENGASGGEREKNILVDCMRNAYSHKLSLPFKVDAAMGNTWGEAA